MSENLQRIVTIGVGADLYCRRLSTGRPGDRLDRADAEPPTGDGVPIDPDLSLIEPAWPAPPGGQPRVQIELCAMPPFVNEFVAHHRGTVPRRKVNPHDMEPALQWACSRLSARRRLGRRSCWLFLAPEGGQCHRAGHYQ